MCWQASLRETFGLSSGLGAPDGLGVVWGCSVLWGCDSGVGIGGVLLWGFLVTGTGEGFFGTGGLCGGDLWVACDARGGGFRGAWVAITAEPSSRFHPIT